MEELVELSNDSAKHLNVADILGPKNLPLASVIPMTIFYSLIFVCGMVGNVSTCLVIANNQYMQTATNMYLFNLAVTDMLTLLAGIPTELYVLWQQYPWNLGNIVCHLKGLISETTANASILTIVAFTAERFLAICYPMRTTSRSKLVRASRVISLIWFVSIVTAVPFAVYQQVNFLYEGDRPIQEASWCGISFADPDWKLLLLIPLSTLFFFAIPMSLILVLYLNIALALRRSGSLRRCASSEAGNSCEAERSQVQCRKMVIRMLVAVVIVFFLCWAPFHAQRLLFTYGTVWDDWNSDTLRLVNECIFYIAGVLYYFNSAINPVLYNVMSKRFRLAFRENLCCRRRRRPARRASNKILVVFRQSGSSERAGSVAGGAGSRAELPPPPEPGVQLCCVHCRGAGSPRSRSEPAHARSQTELGGSGCARHRHGLSKSEGNCPSSWSPVVASGEWRSAHARRQPTELASEAAPENGWVPGRVCIVLENGTHYQRVPLEASI